MNKVGNLKISKRIAALLAASFPGGTIPERVAAEVAAERSQRDGAVLIEVDSSDAALLYGFALGSISKLDAELVNADPAIKHRLLGDHSAWRSLVRQVAPMCPTIPQ